MDGGSAVGLYEADFVRWTEEQAAALRRAGAARLDAPLDWDNLAEEIAGLGARDRREAGALLRALLVNLAKLAHSPSAEPRHGWRREIRTYRERLRLILEDSPSLAARLPDLAAAEREAALDLLHADFESWGEFVEPALVGAFLAGLPAAALADDTFLPDPPQAPR